MADHTQDIFTEFGKKPHFIKCKCGKRANYTIVMPNAIYGNGCTRQPPIPKAKKAKPIEIKVNVDDYCKQYGY